MPDMPQTFMTHLPAGSVVSPLVFDTPHSGSYIPAHIVTDATETERDFLRDAHVEKLLTASPAQNIPVLENLLDRVVIDTNSEEYEVDPRSFTGHWPLPSRLTRNITIRGLGLIATSMKQADGSLRPIFNEQTKLTTQDVLERLDRYHRPYHAALRGLLARAFDAHGYAIHINFHSSPRAALKGRDLLIGNLKGKSAHPDLTHHIQAFFHMNGMNFGENSPYPGGALIRRHSAPEQGLHGIQIEFARDLFTAADGTYDRHKGEMMILFVTSFAQSLHMFADAHQGRLRPQLPQAGRPAILGMDSP